MTLYYIYYKTVHLKCNSISQFHCLLYFRSQKHLQIKHLNSKCLFSLHMKSLNIINIAMLEKSAKHRSDTLTGKRQKMQELHNLSGPLLNSLSLSLSLSLCLSLMACLV